MLPLAAAGQWWTYPLMMKKELVFVITVQEQLCVYDALSTIVSSSTPFCRLCDSWITSLTNDYILY